MKIAVALLVMFAVLYAPEYARGEYPFKLRLAVLIADSYYPDSPCFPHTMKQIIPSSPAEGERVGTLFGFPGPLAAWTFTDSCDVYVDWSAWRGDPIRLKCRMLVHEFGHNAGLLHTNNPRDVMYGGELRDVARQSEDCWRAFPVRSKR